MRNRKTNKYLDKSVKTVLKFIENKMLSSKEISDDDFLDHTPIGMTKVTKGVSYGEQSNKNCLNKNNLSFGETRVYLLAEAIVKTTKLDDPKELFEKTKSLADTYGYTDELTLVW